MLLMNIIVMVLLIALSAFFSGTETALTTITEIKVKNLLKKKVKGARTLKKLKENTGRTLITILIGNNLVNIAASAYATLLATNAFGSKGVGIATGLMTFLVLVFGEISPKTLASANAEKISLMVARPILFLTYLLFPLVLFFEFISKISNRFLGDAHADPTITEEEFKTILEVGHEEHVLEKKEKELIEGVLEFNDIKVKEVMTPRMQIFGLKKNKTLKAALKDIAKCPHSRIPIYDNNFDHIIGVLHIKEALKHINDKNMSVKLEELSEKPLYVTESMIISDLFDSFKKKAKHMAIVLDEFGGTAGIVTMEDILEEILGDIMDEQDKDPELITKINDRTIIVHGNTKVWDINEFLKIKLPEKESYTTINGLILSMKGKIPKTGTRIKMKDCTLKIEKISRKNILKVKVIKNKKN